MAKETMKRYGFHSEGTKDTGTRKPGGSATTSKLPSLDNKSLTSESTPKEPSFRHWAIALTVAALSVLYYESDKHESTPRPVLDAPNAPAEPDTIIRLGENAFIAAAGDAAILATVEMDVEAGGSMTRYYENDLWILSDWLRDNCYITADVTIPATVKAGFQGDLLGAEDVITEYLPDGRLVVTVHMPSPVIVSCCPDYSEIISLSSERHYPNSAANLLELLAGLDAELMASARDDAEEAGILELAASNATLRMVQIMSVLGADSVVVEFGSAGRNVAATNLEGRR